MKILLTGKYGQFGFELLRALAPVGNVFSVDHHECNLADADAIRQLVRSIKPDLIINPAAYAAVDRAESEPDLATPPLPAYPLPARRPANSHLDTTLFCNTFNLELPDWHSGSHHVPQQILTS